MSIPKIKLTNLVEKMQLRNLTPDVYFEKRLVEEPDVNRPSLQLAGFFERFSYKRIQIVGFVEYTFLTRLPYEQKMDIYDQMLSYDSPCYIFCRNLKPDEEFLEKAEKVGIPVFSTDRQTSSFTSELIRWLNIQMAPSVSIHGVLVDVYGVGVLITGESGIGKSESALELIKRGHRLVSDDVVEIHKVSDDTLVGNAPDITRHFIELRGIGIVDVQMLFGAMSVRDTQNIDLVIRLEEWSRDKIYERLGLEEEYTEILGSKIVCHKLPIRPGRNLAIIVETAAINYRQKAMGYNAAQELTKRVQENMLRMAGEQ